MHDLACLKRINACPKAREARHEPAPGLCHDEGATADRPDYLYPVDVMVAPGAGNAETAAQVEARNALITAALAWWDGAGRCASGPLVPLAKAILAYRGAHGS